MTLRDEMHEAVVPWVAEPRAQCERHVTAAIRSITPVEGNNDFRKVLAAGLFAVWSVVTLAQAFGVGSVSGVWYGIMTAVIYTIIGIQWGFELNNMPIAVDVTRDEDTDE